MVIIVMGKKKRAYFVLASTITLWGLRKHLWEIWIRSFCCAKLLELCNFAELR
jgi:hypothetical protein